MNFNDNYKILKVISCSAKGRVSVADNLSDYNESHETVIIKSLDKFCCFYFIEQELGFIPKELHYLKFIDDPSLSPKVLDHFEDDVYYHVVMEHLKDDWVTLYQYTLKKRRENVLKVIFQNIISCLIKLTELNLYYLDLKPSNVMVNRKTGQIKMIDLEDIQYFPFERYPYENLNIGTVGYCAPEITTGEYYSVRSSQSFVIGTTLFSCIERKLFYRLNQETGKYIYYQMNSCSALAKDLIMKLTNPEPELRMDLDNVLKHEWFTLN